MSERFTGKVARYSRQALGSFRNVLLEGQTQYFTIGLGDDHAYPQPGDWITVHGIVKGGRFLTSSWEYAHTCEVCHDPIREEPIVSEETGKREFCSDECLFEAIEDMRIARIEAKQQYDLYGDDLDSWFR